MTSKIVTVKPNLFKNTFNPSFAASLRDSGFCDSQIGAF